MKLDVGIYVEHANRELETAVCLKFLLEKKGLKCRIFSTFFEKYFSKMFSIKFKIIPWCYDSKDLEFYGKKTLFKRKCIFLNLHHEQIGNSSDLNFMLPKDSAKDIYHLAWGDTFAKELCSTGVEDTKILRLGCPRLDFYNAKMKSFSKTKKELAEEFNLDKNKCWILFAENFSLKDYPAHQLKELEKRGLPSIVEFAELSQKTFEIMLEWIEKFLIKNKNFEFIYRAHPSSKDIAFMKERFSKYETIKFINKYSVRDWILNSDIVNVWTSTTGIEVSVAEKKLNIIRPISVPEYLEIDTYKGIRFIENYETFEKENIILDINQNEKMKLEDNIKKFFNVEKDMTSTEKLANKIVALYEESKIEFNDFTREKNILIKIILEKFVSIKFFRKFLLRIGTNSKFGSLRYLGRLTLLWEKNGNDIILKKNILDIEKICEEVLDV